MKDKALDKHKEITAKKDSRIEWVGADIGMSCHSSICKKGLSCGRLKLIKGLQHDERHPHNDKFLIKQKAGLTEREKAEIARAAKLPKVEEVVEEPKGPKIVPGVSYSHQRGGGSTKEEKLVEKEDPANVDEVAVVSKEVITQLTQLRDCQQWPDDKKLCPNFVKMYGSDGTLRWTKMDGVCVKSTDCEKQTTIDWEEWMISCSALVTRIASSALASFTLFYYI